MTKKAMILGASMGDCVHVAGVIGFLRLAEAEGYRTEFMGAARSPQEIAAAAKRKSADIVAVGYRLDPEAARHLSRRLVEALGQKGVTPRLWFGGTAPVADAVAQEDIYDAIFSGREDLDQIIAFLKGKPVLREATSYPSRLGERIAWKRPYPVIRHHFGLPSVEETAQGIRRIAEAGVLDVVSLGPDQNAQEHFFHPEEMDGAQDGAGGVSIRSPEDLESLYAASRTGNNPLMRCYSGTKDVLRFAQVLLDTVNNAWAAIPLTWYNVLDGRGPRGVLASISEGQEAVHWHARRGVPVEMNESHHWSLRDAPDSVAVAAAYLGAYNAKMLGVGEYVSQYMWNTPAGTSLSMDLGKMLAKDDLIGALADQDFQVYKQVRAGLFSFPTDLHQAKGHLALSTTIAMALEPHIVHVVGYCEADHLASADEVIESCLIARGAIRSCLRGAPDLRVSPDVVERRAQLTADAKTLLDGIAELHRLLGTGAIPPPQGAAKLGLIPGDDPFSDPITLSIAVGVGLLDAPHLKGNPHASGRVVTEMIDGACLAIDPQTRRPIAEKERIGRILEAIAPKRAAQ